MTAYAVRDANGIYWHRALPHPSVSTIIKWMKWLLKGEDAYEYSDDRYPKRGTVTHSAIEAWHEGLLDVTERYIADWVEREIVRAGFCGSIDVPFTLPHVMSAIRWCADNVESIDHIEVVTFFDDGFNRCAGRKDAHGVLLKKRPGKYLIDWKTASTMTPQRWHLVAMSAYHHMATVADDSKTPIILPPCNAWGNVMITPEGAELRTWTDQQIYSAFWSCFYPALRSWFDQRMIADFMGRQHLAGRGVTKEPDMPARRATKREREIAADVARWKRPLETIG